MGEEGKAKEKIIIAALELFYHKGFSGTTVREISAQANVNLALISYYFGGKKGLLEEIMVRFYEGYFEHIRLTETEASFQGEQSALEHLILVIDSAFHYLFHSYRMTRFIYRELTLDSMLIREVMTIYLAKEKHYYQTIIEKILVEEQHQKQDADILLLQLLQLLYMPFLQPQVIREVYYMEPHHEQFKLRYIKQLRSWLKQLSTT